MSSKYLFLISSLPPSRSANGLCVKNVLTEFSDLKDVFAITLNDDSPKNDLGITEIRIPLRPWDKISSLISKSPFFIALFLRCLLFVKRLIMLPIWPIFSLTTCFYFFKTSSLLIKEKNVTHIVAVCYPGESLIAMVLLKLRFKNRIKTIMYPLDVFLGGKFDGLEIEKKISKLFSPLLYKFCSYFADKIIVLENAKDLYMQKLYTQKHKFAICGLPLIENASVKEPPPNGKDGIQLLYGGNIIPSIRNPDYLFYILNEIALKKSMNIVVNIYGAIGENLLKKYISKYNSVRFNYYGWVTENELTNAIDKANALISVGNSVGHLIPSKIFKYISLKKPIIHLSFLKNDPCLPYLKRYGHTFFVENDVKINLNDFSLWLRLLESYKITLDCEKMFPQCMPVFTANVIQSC